MKSREIIKFISETLRNIGVGFVISSIVLFLSNNTEPINSVLLFLLGTYNIGFGTYLFFLSFNGGK